MSSNVNGRLTNSAWVYERSTDVAEAGEDNAMPDSVNTVISTTDRTSLHCNHGKRIRENRGEPVCYAHLIVTVASATALANKRTGSFLWRARKIYFFVPVISPKLNVHAYRWNNRGQALWQAWNYGQIEIRVFLSVLYTCIC